MTETYALHKESKWMFTLFGTVLPLGVYIIAGILSLLYEYIKCSCCTSDCCKPIYSRLHISESAKIAAKLFTIIGGIFYFVGDNLHFKNKLVLLVLGFITYRIIPSVMKKLQRHFKCTPNQHKTRVFNCWSPNDNETHSLIVAYVFPLTIVIDFNIWLKVILQHTSINANNLCNETEQVKQEITVIRVFTGMMCSFLIIEVVIGVIFIFAGCRPHSKNPFKLILPTRTKRITRVGCIVWDIVLSVALFIAVTAFLSADGNKILLLLDCRNESDDTIGSLIRLTCLMTSFIIFFVFIMGFYLRNICCCVQVKGDIISVDVLSDNQLKVYIEDETGMHSFNYQLHTSEITDSDCNHAETYKSDIEHIAKYLGGIDIGKLVKINVQESQVALDMDHESDHPLYTINDIENIVKCLGGDSRLVAVNVQYDQVAVIREVEGKLYLVLHYTSEPTKTEMYKVRDEQNSLPDHISESEAMHDNELNDFGPSKLIAIYTYSCDPYQQQKVCFILLRNYNEEKYAVRKTNQKDATPFKNLASFNVQDGQEVLVVPSNSDLRHPNIIQYNPNNGHFDFQHQDMNESQNAYGPALKYRGSINNCDDNINSVLLTQEN